MGSLKITGRHVRTRHPAAAVRNARARPAESRRSQTAVLQRMACRHTARRTLTDYYLPAQSSLPRCLSVSGRCDHWSDYAHQLDRRPKPLVSQFTQTGTKLAVGVLVSLIGAAIITVVIISGLCVQRLARCATDNRTTRYGAFCAADSALGTIVLIAYAMQTKALAQVDSDPFVGKCGCSVVADAGDDLWWQQRTAK